jgi:Bacteriophage head to tail connecting protein
MAEAAPTVRRESEKRRLMRRKAMLWKERAAWVADWQQLVDYVAPMAGRFVQTDRARGDKVARAKKINDSTGRRSLRVLAAGLQAGMSSPARPWFRLSTGDLVLDDNYEVKTWLRDVEDKIRSVFASSNVYRALHQVYLELGAFGTAASVMLPDFDDVVHMMTLTIGEYALVTDSKGRVVALARELSMTVGQLVDDFGYANCSTHVQNLYDKDVLDVWVDLEHIVEPRKNRDPSKVDAVNKKFRSVYYEVGGQSDRHEGLLRDSGFDSFCVLAPRWEVNGNDTYGTGPGHEALPSIRELQHAKLRKGQAIDYQTQPPLQVPVSLKAHGMNRLPGGEVYVDAVGSDNAIKTLFDVTLDLSALREDIQETREAIRQHFFEDLFLMIANDNRSGITATEIAERHEEKMLMLGPVLERLQNELFDPLIDFTFERLAKNGGFPPPPEALQDRELSVEYIGLLAQAQRAVALRSNDRLIATVGSIASATGDPSVWDNLDVDEFVEEYAEGLGVAPKLIRSKEMREAMREQRNAQQQMAQAAATAEQAAKAGAAASQIDPNQIQDVMGMFQGYGSPTAMEIPA